MTPAKTSASARNVARAVIAVVVVFGMVIGFPMTATAATDTYWAGNANQYDSKFSGYRNWKTSSGYGDEMPLVIVMEAKAGSVTAQGTGGATVFIPASQQVRRYISCRWVGQGGWTEPNWVISCYGDY